MHEFYLCKLCESSTGRINLYRSGSDVTLICTVLLTSGPGIDVPLNVTFELLRMDPAGSPLTTTTSSVTGSTYITTAMISSFGRNDSGVYTCRATASSASTNTYISDSNIVSHSTRLTTGEMFIVVLSRCYGYYSCLCKFFRCLS